MSNSKKAQKSSAPTNGNSIVKKPSGSGSAKLEVIDTPQASLLKIASFGATAVSPGFSLFRDQKTGLIVLSTKHITDDSVDPETIFAASTPADLESWVRQFTVVYKREIFPEIKA